ncbi:M15 family metallopeptidase [Microbacterium ureisolvens]|uniref:M15 family metallopeptidase n=1 Tax=Microbacterium ureisolvens TaxID=2781186 RepID=UPI003635E9AD
MTEPGGLVTPRAAPETRRAARAMREEAARRARAAESPAVAAAQPWAARDPAAPVPAAADPVAPASDPTVPVVAGSASTRPAAAGSALTVPLTTAPVVSFELPSDDFVPASVATAAAAPSALPLGLQQTRAEADAPVGLVARTAPETRVRGRRRARPASRPAWSERRAARAAELLEVDDDAQPVRHARPRLLTRRLAVAAGLTAGAVLLMGSAAMTAMMLPPAADDAGADAAVTMTAVQPETVQQLPVPDVEQTPPAADICAVPDVVAALQSGNDEGAIVAAGGGEAFRAAVVEGRASCVNLGDSARIWAVVDKIRPASPIDYRPSGLVLPDGVRSIEGGALRADAASALASLVTAARDAGVGEVALESGFRSYETQQQTYGRHFAERGERADQVSARPGYSEHQLGLGADVVACAGACGTLDQLAATPQGQWIAEHAWEHGWIVRYLEGKTPVTGYTAEPWHLRFIGPELARAYHDGGWTSLEEFFALDPAPGYLG